MSLDAPLWLLLLVPLALFELWRRRRAAEAGATRWLRRLALAAVVLALAGPEWPFRGGIGKRVVVVDRGLSVAAVDDELRRIAEEESRREGASSLAVVVFDARARELPLAAGALQLPVCSSAPATAHAEALALAADLVPPGAAGEIVLISDGRSLHLSERQCVLELAQRGVALTTRLVGAAAPAPLLRNLAVPSRVRCGETFRVRATLDDPRGLVSSVELRRGDGSSAARRTAAAKEISIEDSISRAGLAELELLACGAEGAVLARATLALAVMPPMALHLRADPEVPERRAALQRILGEDARFVDTLDEAEVVLIEDVPADALDAEFLGELQRAVAGGTGLLATGGRRSFGPGGWQETALDPLLPLGADEKEERRDPSATLVLILDTSGSMQGTRIELAKEVARLALARLKPHDKAGIVEFHGARRWAAPIQSAANAVDLQRALNRLTAGGGTIILPAIEEAYHALLNARTRTRHVLVITDGGVESGDFESLLRRMADKGITTSTVMVGSGGGLNNFLFSLSQWGKGRFYHAPDRFELPEVRVKQPESAALAPWREERTEVRSARHAAWTDGFGPLDGFVETVARPGSVVDARSSGGEALLARWRHGAGKVAAFAGTLTSPWNATAAHSGATGRALLALLHELAPDRGPEPELCFLEGRVAVRLPAGLAAELKGPAGVVARFAAGAPGSEEALRVVQGTPRGVLQLAGSDGALLAALAVPSTSAWTSSAPDPGALQELDQLSRAHLVQGRGHHVALRIPLLVIALLAFVAQVAARRLLPLVLLLVSLQPVTAQEPTLSASVRAACERAILKEDLSAAELVALVLAESGDCDKALDFAEQLAKGRGDAAQRVVVQLALNSGLPERALTALASIKSASREDLLLRARCEEHLGRDEAARSTLEGMFPLTSDRSLEVTALLRHVALLPRPQGLQQVLGDLEQLRTAAEPGLQLAVAVEAALAGEPRWLLEHARASGASFDIQMLAAALALEGALPAAEIEVVLEAARGLAPRAVDRRMVDERIMALHRRTGTLPALATRWLGGADRAERTSSLVALLRELSRPAEALELLRAGGDDVSDERVQREVIALALECGRFEEVERAYQERMTAEPGRLAWVQGLALLQLFSGRREAAVQVMEAALERTPPGPKQLQVANLSADLGLQDVAAHALERALAADAKTALRARIVAAELALRGGDETVARAELARAEAAAGEDPEALVLVAQALERSAMPLPAIKILERVVEKTGAEDARLQLAWLLEQRQKFPEAFAHWREIWRVSTTAARRRHAEERLLELGARAGLLADLAVDTEKDLAAGKGSPEAVQLLARIYQRAGDQAAAVEVLRDHGARFGKGEAEILESLARVYESCDDYPRHEEALRQLMLLRPEDAVALRQQLVLAALERGRGKAADRLLAELVAEHANDPAVDEFSAGVLGMVQRVGESADAWGRVLARNPDRIEAWLLRGNMLQAAGEGPRAIQLYLLLLEEAPKDDLFTVAADGLLNLKAPRRVLECALRRVHARIAVRPASAFLWQLAADFEEELGRPERQRLMLTALAAVSGERRGACTRELFELARERGERARVLEEGRALLALGEEFPPDVFLALGEAMLAAGDTRGAERVFLRARGPGEWLEGQKAVAELLARHGREADAERILRQALLARPDDVALLLDVSALAEMHGAFEAAAADALRALRLLCARSPGEDVKGGVGRKPPRPQRGFTFLQRSQQEDLHTRFSEPALRALLVNGNAQAAAALVADLRAEIARLTDLPARGGLLKDHPRLERLWQAVIAVEPVLGSPGALVSLAREVQALFPRDESPQSLAARALAERGCIALAADTIGAAPELLRTAVPEAWRRESMADALALGRLARDDAPLAADFAVRLWLAGKRDAARALVGQLDPVSCRLGAGQRASFLVLVVELGDVATIQRWWQAAFEDTLQNADALTGAFAALDILRASAVLAPAVETLLKNELARRRAGGNTLVLECLARLEDPARAAVDLPAELFSVLASGVAKSQSLERWHAFLNAADRARLLELKLLAASGTMRWQILNLAGKDVPDSEAMTTALLAAWRAARPRSMGNAHMPQEYEAYAVLKAGFAPATALALIEMLRAEAGEVAGITLAHGIALLHAGNETTGAQFLATGLAALFAAREPSFQSGQFLDLLATDTHPGLARQLDEALKTFKPEQGPLAARLHVARLRARGDLAGATVLARASAKRWPGSTIADEFERMLEARGEWLELAELETAEAERSTAGRDWQLANAANRWMLLGRLDKARALLDHIEEPDGAFGPRIALAVLASDDAEAQRAWRRSSVAKVRFRNPGSVLPSWYPEQMPGRDLGVRSVFMASAPALLGALLASDAGVKELQRLARATLPDMDAAVLEKLCQHAGNALIQPLAAERMAAENARQLVALLATGPAGSSVELERAALAWSEVAPILGDAPASAEIVPVLARSGHGEEATRLERFHASVDILGGDFSSATLCGPDAEVVPGARLRRANWAQALARRTLGTEHLARVLQWPMAPEQRALLLETLRSGSAGSAASAPADAARRLALLGDAQALNQLLARHSDWHQPERDGSTRFGKLVHALAAPLEHEVLRVLAAEAARAAGFAVPYEVAKLQHASGADAAVRAGMDLLFARCEAVSADEHALIELARGAGDEARARTLERRLLREGRLFPPLIPAVLDAAAELPAAERSALAEAAARFGDLVVLRRYAALFLRN